MSFVGLNRACDAVLDFEVEDDVEGERDVHSPETWTSIAESPASSNASVPRDEDLEAAVIRNSKEVAEGTDREYRRYVSLPPPLMVVPTLRLHRLMATFEKWLVENGYIKSGETVFGADVPAKTPLFICVWIMSSYVWPTRCWGYHC
jgi:hypothetical protein